MDALGALGFVFGLLAFSQVGELKKTIKELEAEIERLSNTQIGEADD